MLFSESWLRTYVNPAISSEELQDALTMHGLEVDEARKAAPDFTGVVIAEVVECRDHENSDHLHVCQVNAGTGELIQIVCGAPNVRAGVRVPCAMVGAELPGGFKIKKAKLRGVPSNGMLCSARELGVSEDHDGLWLLPEDAPIGEDIRKYAHLDDVVVDLNVTPNRGDALSLTGIAREVHAVTGAELKLPEIHEAAVTTDAAHAVKIEASDLCARYTSRVITGLNAKAKTPEWMAERLERCGQRPISALVDISNYVLLELGRPTHFFDLDKLSGTVTARWAKKGEKIELLNGKTVDLTPYYGVIADDNGSQAIAGIMGGSADSVSDDTVNLFIESAFFRPAAIQGRARKLNFSSDSSFRFERGVDYGTTREHLEYITALVLSICGTDTTRVGPVSDIESDLPERRVVKFRAARCRKLVGVDIPTDFMEEAFKRLGFEYTRDGDLFTVTSPTYRFDIAFPCLRPVVGRSKYLLSPESHDSGPWKIARTPVQFALENGLLLDEQGKAFTPEQALKNGLPSTELPAWGNARLDEKKALAVLTEQLGKPFEGYEGLSPCRRALAVAFLAYAGGDKKGCVALLDAVSLSYREETGQASCPLLEDSDFAGKLKKQWERHASVLSEKCLSIHAAYELPWFMALLYRARQKGVLAGSQFLWLRPMDRPLWYALNQCGGRAAWAEGFAAWAHYMAEEQEGKALTESHVAPAVASLREALSAQGWLTEIFVPPADAAETSNSEAETSPIESPPDADVVLCPPEENPEYDANEDEHLADEYY